MAIAQTTTPSTFAELGDITVPKFYCIPCKDQTGEKQYREVDELKIHIRTEHKEQDENKILRKIEVDNHIDTG